MIQPKQKETTTNTSTSSTDTNETDTEEVTLPKELAYQLNKLNQLQTQYNKSAQQIVSMRKQLFADWYKYMVCA